MAYRRVLLSGLAFSAGLLSGCPTAPTGEADGGQSDSGLVDSGTDSGVDAGIDAGGGIDAGPSDGGTDGGADSGTIPCVPPVNGCDAGDYLDATDAGAVVDVFFGDAGFPFAYVPRCVRIASGQSLRFQGSFGVHPLRQSCGPAPAIPFVVSGTSRTLPFSQAGDYGFICTEHWAMFGMMGAVNVLP